MSYVFQPELIQGIEITVQPYEEPLHLDEVKLHLKQDDITTDDTTIASLMVAGRDVVETETGKNRRKNRVCMSTKFSKYLDVFPNVDFIQLPRVPLSSAVADLVITYVDTNGDTQTLSTDVYTFDPSTGRILLKYAQVWPATQFQRKSITISFIAGQATKFTAVAATDVVTLYGRTLTDGDRVRVMNSGGALPAGLSAKTDYFVINASGATCKFSLTSGGAAVDITDTGTGIQYVSTDLIPFETMRNAIKLMVTHLYRNRSAVVVGTIAQQLPLAVDSLCAAAQA